MKSQGAARSKGSQTRLEMELVKLMGDVSLKDRIMGDKSQDVWKQMTRKKRGSEASMEALQKEWDERKKMEEEVMMEEDKDMG